MGDFKLKNPTGPASEAAFAFAVKLSRQAVTDGAGLVLVLGELASMNAQQISDRIDTLKVQIKLNQTKTVLASATATIDTIAAKQAVPGHYMIDGSHVQVKLPKFTKAAYVIKDGAYMPAKWPETQAILADVAANGQTYAIAYAAKTGKCGVCNTKLTDPKSVAAGIGPVCAKKYA